MRARQRALLLGALWPGFGQLACRRARLGLALGLAPMVLWIAAFRGFGGPAALAWLALWAWGIGDLVIVLWVVPARRERADRLLRAGVAYLLRGDLARAEGSLDRAASLSRLPAAALYLAQAERRLGRKPTRLARLSQEVRGGAWRWEIERAMAAQGGLR